ncbi:MAG: prepilin-type N-terminal cleavage/methylation domain-containing protein [Actinobacteria bacterium]|nr:MAG: prepilin-type N-terminal cleavage/methylation domain-containing protein [Actinomycetota bacterium]
MSLVKRHLAGQDGFTLVEMCIVAAIIAILLLIAVGTQTASSRLAESVACQSNLRNCRQGVDFYVQTNGTYPSDLDVLVPGELRAAGTRCPTSKAAYEYEGATGRVWCPEHE